MSSKYYVYMWKNPKTDEVFYIGKGKEVICYNRAVNKHHSGRCENKRRKLLVEGFTNEQIVFIVESNLLEEEALKLETQLIEKYGILEEGGTLFNFRKNGTASGSWQKYRSSDIQQIVEAYKSGSTMLEIGNMYNVHETTIRRYLKMNNIEIRRQGYTVPHPENWSDIVEEMKKGRSQASVIKEYKFSLPTLYRLLRERPNG